MDPLSNPAILILAAVLPALIAFVKQSGFSTQINAILALIVYAVFGILGALLTGVTPSVENLVPFITVVATVGTVAYNLFWSNLGVKQEGDISIEQRIQDVTSVVK